MLDVLGAALRDTRSKQKVTMMQRPEGWSRNVIGLIVNGLMTETSSLPAQPTVLLVWGEHGKDELFAFVQSDFEHKIITGLDSKEMPWHAW